MAPSDTSSRPVSRIACLGEVMIEIVPHDSPTAAINVAGDTFNTAVYLTHALRGSGFETAYVTALGTDPLSDRILAAITDHGLDITLVERRENLLPGLYAIHTDATGERSFSYWRSTSAARTLFSPPVSVPMTALARFDLLYLSGISVAILPPDTRERLLDWIDGFRDAGGQLAFDSNYRPRLWEDVKTAREVTAAFWHRCDIALPSADDEAALFGDADTDTTFARLQGYGLRTGALKRGAEGPLDLDTGRTPGGLDAVHDVVDTTAAGDSFNAGYLAAWLRGLGQEAALRQGHALAATVIRHRGAILPDALLAYLVANSP